MPDDRLTRAVARLQEVVGDFLRLCDAEPEIAEELDTREDGELGVVVNLRDAYSAIEALTPPHVKPPASDPVDAEREREADERERDIRQASRNYRLSWTSVDYLLTLLDAARAERDKARKVPQVDDDREREIREAVKGHTPGPWILGDGPDPEVYASDGIAWITSQVVSGAGDGPDDDGRTNGALIAAAPELLTLLDAARAERDTLTTELKSDREVCICGCPLSEHDSYGEDGESCEHEDHECLRVSRGVQDAFRAQRGERDAARAERDTLRSELEQPPPELLDKWMKNELADYAMVCKHCTEVYMHFSDGMISKPNTYPSEVIALSQEREQRATEAAIKEVTADLEAERDRLRDHVKETDGAFFELFAAVLPTTEQDGEPRTWARLILDEVSRLREHGGYAAWNKADKEREKAVVENDRLRETARKLRDGAMAQQSLLVSYRLGKRTTDKVLDAVGELRTLLVSPEVVALGETPDERENSDD